MARVLITGHDGFTGRYLWDTLQRNGHEPCALKLANELVDLRNEHDVLAAFKSIRPDKVLHLAAISSVDHHNARQIYEVNLLGTRNLLEAAANAKLEVERLVIASSANLYGNQVGPLSEQSSVQPVNDYAVSKASMELLAKSYGDRLPIVIARPFNYTGVGQSTRFVIAKIVNHLLSQNLSISLGNLDVARDFSDIRDIAYFYCQLLEQPTAIGETFNLCSGTPTALGEILTYAEAISGKKLSVVQDPSLMRPSEIKVLYGDPTKLDRLIGEYRRRSVKETLKWMLQINQ